jgi:hypothetical protein
MSTQTAPSTVVCELAKAAHRERHADQQATSEGKVASGIHGGLSIEN